MGLVTLADVTLFRVGSPQSFVPVSSDQLRRVREVEDDSLQTLRDLVVMIAEEEGEAPGSLTGLTHAEARASGYGCDGWVFNIQGPGSWLSVQYGQPYAHCHAYPALKVGKRYFKLEEVSL